MNNHYHIYVYYNYHVGKMQEACVWHMWETFLQIGDVHYSFAGSMCPACVGNILHIRKIQHFLQEV